ncbi:von Willebrand factor A domain-containing protein 2-like [Mya arenaria]|uniref:von Willebrand factor A domain-containing protein 2-like n=1 Tax=Mya arenaria TaxID=6604 RepID=UPI0022DF772B|nr:von Willebrand factor A domain-containing protein 2-like [Mya arenaria]
MYLKVPFVLILSSLLGMCRSAICNSDKKADIVFLIDGSGSMTLKGFEETKSFIEKFISLFNIGPSKTQVGVMVFGSSAVIQFNLNKYNSADGVKNGLRDIEYPRANTDVAAEALRLAKSSMFTPGGGNRAGAEKVVILMTDGYSQTSDDNLVAAGELKAAEITIYTAGLDGANREEMESIASGKDYYFSVKDYDAFDNLRDLLAITTCTNTGGCLCVNGGSCPTGSAECQCPPPFTGWGCLYDFCSPGYNPCSVYGSCNVTGSGYTCTCNPGHAGRHCDTDIDECASNPCVNGACVNRVDRFTCNCLRGYTGTVCDEEIDECAVEKPCMNGATCHDLIADFRCECVPGFMDKRCSTDINECASDPCQNDGTCQDRVNYFECLCPVGYYGWYCETATCQPTMADVIFLLDSSISQTEDDFQKQLTFINRFVDHVVVDEKNFRVGVVTFSFEAHLEISLTDYGDNVTLKEAVSNITYRPGGTLTHLGLEMVTQHVKDISPKRLFENTAKRYVFLLTDGMSIDRQRTLDAATELRKYVTKILAIGIGTEVSHNELLGVASPGDERAPEYVFSVHNFNALYTVIQQLVALTCDECFWNTSSDVTFLLDMRSGISDLDFSQAVDALTYVLTETLDKSYNVTVRLALVSYDDESVQIHRNLTDTATTDTLVRYIQMLTVTRSCDTGSSGSCGTSNINTLDKALQKIEQGIFSESKDEARQTIILFTNGDHVPIVPEPTLARLKVSGRLVLVVGVGEQFEVGSFQGLVSDPAYVFVSRSGEQYNTLDVIATEIFYSSCELSNNF